MAVSWIHGHQGDPMLDSGCHVTYHDIKPIAGTIEDDRYPMYINIDNLDVNIISDLSISNIIVKPKHKCVLRRCIHVMQQNKQYNKNP